MLRLVLVAQCASRTTMMMAARVSAQRSAWLSAASSALLSPPAAARQLPPPPPPQAAAGRPPPALSAVRPSPQAAGSARCLRTSATSTAAAAAGRQRSSSQPGLHGKGKGAQVGGDVNEHEDEDEEDQGEGFWEYDQDEDGDEERRSRKRGIPAEMRYFDRAKIYVKAGDGGDGVVAFRREKFVAHGGPSGGSGGRGGDVVLEVDPSLNSLHSFRRKVHFRAGRGSHGGGKNKEGAAGTDITIAVPPGTIVRAAPTDIDTDSNDEDEQEESRVLAELMHPHERMVLIGGGRGGRGNASFKTSRNKAPQLAEHGEKGREVWLELELKLVADVGIVGAPNAGKSTLLSAISAARPKIAAYPFTTLVPNLGVCAIPEDDFETVVYADIPGLLEGAHAGVGLGLEFLRHCERCRVLVHMVDGTSPDPMGDYDAIMQELRLFNPSLVEKPHVVGFNKMDIPEAQELWPEFKRAMEEKGVESFAISAVAREGVRQLAIRAKQLLKELPAPSLEKIESIDDTLTLTTPGKYGRPIDDFHIECDAGTRTWFVHGEGIERFTQMTNWEYYEAAKRFQKVLEASGISTALRRAGVREKDIIVIGELQFDWSNEEDWTGFFEEASNKPRRGSAHWPH
eukprot:jgi/Chlat1/6425/Chrsp45S05944